MKNIFWLNMLCYIFGHNWKYNFPSLPNKAICTRCKIKQELNLHTLEWKNVKKFKCETRIDEELCKDWN
jgi:hypothetical protein